MATIFHGPVESCVLIDTAHGKYNLGYLKDCTITKTPRSVIVSSALEVPLNDLYEFSAVLVQTDDSQLTELRTRARYAQQIEVQPAFQTDTRFILFSTFVKVRLMRGGPPNDAHTIEIKGQTDKQVNEIFTNMAATQAKLDVITP